MDLSLQQLKEIAIKLEFNHSPNIGSETLKTKLEAYAAELGTTLEEVTQSMTLDTKKVIKSIVPDSTATVEPSLNDIAEATGMSISELEKLSKLSFADAEGIQAQKTESAQTRDAMKLIRAMITCNNKNKTNYKGEIFCARNAVLPEVKKFISFGVPTHIPQILFNVIKEKQYQMYRTERTREGVEFKKSYLVPEYNIQLLPPLTPEEFNAIKTRQLAQETMEVGSAY